MQMSYQSRLINKTNSNKCPSSIVILIDEQQDIESISHFDNQFDLQSKDTLCLFFSQYGKVVYRKIKEEQHNFDLRQFATEAIRQNYDLILPQLRVDQMQMIFRRISKDNKLIQPNTLIQLDEVKKFQIIEVIITNDNVKIVPISNSSLIKQIYIPSYNMENPKFQKKNKTYDINKLKQQNKQQEKSISLDQESELHLKQINKQPLQNNQYINIQRYEEKSKSFMKQNQVNLSFVTILYDQHKDFKIRDLFHFYKINKKGHSVLTFKNQFVRHNEPLSKFQPAIIAHSGKVICSQNYIFELFYNEAKVVLSQMKNQTKYQQQLIFNLMCQNDATRLLKKYQQCKSCNLDRITHLIILYLTSPYFNPTFQIQYFKKYLNGSIHFSAEDVQTQTMLILINKIVNFNSNNIYCGPIYVAEKKENSRHFKPSQIVRFQTFLAGAKQIKHSYNSKEIPNLIYQIQAISAKYVELYSFQPLKLQYIFLPYSQYYVNYITRKDNINIVKLIQLPLPRRMDTNLILWINNTAKQSHKRYINQLKLKKCYANIQILQFKNNLIFQVWLRRYNSLIKMRKIGVISNIVDDQMHKQAIQTIHLSHAFIQEDASIMLFVDQLETCPKIVATSKNLSKTIICHDRDAELLKFLNKFKDISYESQQQSKNQECKMPFDKCKLI